jgi:hypothetical protein
VVGTGGGSVTASGNIQLVNPALNLIPGASYTVTVTANYTNLTNGAGLLEPQTVTTTLPCTVTIQSGATMAVRNTQVCSYPATLLPATYMRADPFVCGATNYTFRFTPASDCNGTTSGTAFELTHPSRVLQLNFNGTNTIPLGMTILPQHYYNVEVRPNFGVGGTFVGTWGPVRTIFVAGTSAFEYQEENEEVLIDLEEIESSLLVYPNPIVQNVFYVRSNQFANEPLRVRILDSMGRVIYQNQYAVYSGAILELSSDLLPANGLYYIELLGSEDVQRTSIVLSK